MRILFLANDDEGIYKFRKELIETLLKDNEVFLSLPYGQYVDILKEKGCKFIDTQFNRKGTNPVKDLELVKFYNTIIKEIKPDVVLSYTIKPNVYGGLACQMNKVPYIANVTGISAAIDNGGLVGKIAETLYKVGLRKAKMVFFQNEANKQYMIDHKIVKNNYDLLPGSGVNLDEYQILDFPNGDTVDFVFVARILKEKGVDQYLDAAKYIREKYPNTRFHMCGTYDDEEYVDIINDLRNKGIINYHGQVLDMREIYKLTQCTIHPSYYPEGLSNALLESMASGKAIITTDKPGCKELVNDGVNGYLIKQKDSESLINAIEKFLNLSIEERKQMGLQGRKIVEERYSRDIVIDKYLKAIKQ